MSGLEGSAGVTFDVWVDFNSVSDGVVQTLASFVPSHVTLAPGRSVVVGDDEGTVARATVESVDGELVTLRVDASSVVSAPVSGIAQ